MDREARGLEAGAPLLLESSVKKGFDLNWSDPDEKAEAIPMLLNQLTSLEQWVAEQLTCICAPSLITSKRRVRRPHFPNHLEAATL